MLVPFIVLCVSYLDTIEYLMLLVINFLCFLSPYYILMYRGLLEFPTILGLSGLYHLLMTALGWHRYIYSKTKQPSAPSDLCFIGWFSLNLESLSKKSELIMQEIILIITSITFSSKRELFMNPLVLKPLTKMELLRRRWGISKMLLGYSCIKIQSLNLFGAR